MKNHVAFLLLGCVALSSATGYANQMRKTLQPLPLPRNNQHQYAAAEPLPAAGAPGTGAYDEVPAELPAAPVQQPVQVVYKAPTRIVEKAPIRVAAPGAYDDVAAPPPRRGYGGAVAAKQNQRLQQQEEEDLNLEEEEFARNAQYSFATAVDDGIHDQSQIRQETRDGTKVTGTYAYSDGYYKRTVNYEADENGYRVVSESVEPLGEDGPQVDFVNGKAEVHTQIAGVNTQYGVSADELLAATKRANKLAANEDKEAKDGY